LSKDVDLTRGNVSLRLFGLAGPMVFGLVAVLSQSLVDTYFVGKLGTVQLAALSFTFPVALTFTSLAIGLSAGASSVVSRVIGAGNRQEARRWVTDGLILSAVIATSISIIGILTISPLFALLGASDEALTYIQRYMPIWYASMPFLVVGIVGHGAMRANGESRWPSVIMVVTAAINIALTPILMFGLFGFPQLEIEGVALATLVSRVFTFVVTLALLRWLLQLMIFRLPKLGDLKRSGRSILKIAGPAGAGNMANPIGIAIVTALLAAYGNSTVAAFGVATRIEAFACLPMLALSSAIGPIAGQNWGAQKIDRIIDALKACFIISALNSLLLVGLFWFAGDWLVGLFSSEQAVQAEARTYLIYVSFSLWGYGLVVTTAAAFNGIGRSGLGLGIYAVRILLLYVPLSYIATLIAASEAVFIAISISNALAGLACAGFSIWWLKSRARSQ